MSRSHTIPSKVLPFNFNSREAEEELLKVAKTLPEGVEVFMIGGAVRNALFRHFHGDVLQQRDYDQIITKNSEEYFAWLAEHGYEKGKIDRPTQRVMRKPFSEAPKMDDYNEWIVFDCHMVDGTTAIENLRNHVGLTVNGFALSFRDITAPNWMDKLITLPSALEDLRAKRLSVNREGYKDQAANFFACLRFMSAGFSPPPADEVQLLLNELPRVEHERYENNVQKVYNYVGGEQKARELVRSLGIDMDVFDEDVVKGK